MYDSCTDSASNYLQSGDIETNLGPKKNTEISFCHENLYGIAAHNFS